ncbi:MAG: hypothetical protein ACTSQP_08245 [Promethearchaeota archaeon]
MTILNIENFIDEDLPEVFKIGFLSNDAICTLSKIIRKKRNEIDQKDINTLKDILTLLEDVEKGKETIESFQYIGSASNKVSLYWQLIKLIYIFSMKSFDEIINEISKNRKEIGEIIDYLNDKIDLSEKDKKEKISRIKNFLSVLSKSYQNVFFNIR